MTTAHLHICSFFFTDIFLIIIPPSILHMGLEALQFTAVYPPVCIYINVCRDGGMLLPASRSLLAHMFSAVLDPCTRLSQLSVVLTSYLYLLLVLE